MKKHLPIIIFTIIIGAIVLGIWYSDLPRGKAGKDSPIKELAKLNIYSKKELSFLEEQGFLDNLDNVDTEKISNSQEVIKALKSPGLIEQNLNSPDESFEVLATKLNLNRNTYQLAFKLENRSNQSKEFYLIPVSDETQTQFKEIRGRISGTITEVYNTPLAELYDVEEHRLELKPELAQTYTDIKYNNYQAKPIKLTLSPKSTIIAQAKWEINRDRVSDSLEPVYLLVYGSAGGVKDELTILNVHSSPQKGDNWAVEFITKGTNDLYIIPNDQATIDDDEFTGLYCDEQEKIPQILENDVIYYPNWQCDGTGKVVHYTKKAGDHVLRFEFGNQISYAYNNPGVAFDAVTSVSYLDSTKTWEHTIGAGSNFLLVVGVSLYGDDTVTAITYDGGDLTRLAYKTRGAGPNVRTELWYLKGVATGAADVVITNTSGRVVAGAVSYSGVDQNDTFGTVATAGSYSSAVSVSVVSAIDELVIDVFGCQSADDAQVGAGQTERWNRIYGSSVEGAGSEEDGAESVDMTWTLNSSKNWAAIGVSLKPSTAATTPSVTTNAATLVEATTATGNGNITDTGGENCDKRGIVYGKSSQGDPGNVAPGASGYDDYEEETDGFGTGAFTRSLTSLDASTKYYARAYAHNSAGYSYGNEIDFTTEAPPAAAIYTLLSGTFDIDGNLTIGNSTDTMKVTADTNDPTIDLEGNFYITANSTFTASDTASFNVGGNWSNSGTFTHSTGTVTLDGSSGTQTVTSGGDSFYHLEINNTDTSVQLEDDLDVNGNLTISAGTLDTKSGENNPINIAGNWTFAGGTFECRQSTVTFDNASSTSTLTGSTTFYVLISTTTGKNVKVSSDTVIGVTNHLNFENITLRSTSGGATWYLNLSGTQDVSNVDVRDSNASGSTDTIIAFTSTDSGNNTKWDFGPPAAITDLTGLCYSDTGKVTLSWSTPGDDEWSGTLPSGSRYGIGYSSYSIQWSTASFKVEISTSGVSPHTKVSRSITGLTGDTTWYFRIWTADEIPLWSDLSNGCTVWVNPILSVSISTNTYNFGELNASTAAVSTNITVTNDGNVTETYSIKSSSFTTRWVLKDKPGNDEFTLQAAFHPSEPKNDDIDWESNDILTESLQQCTTAAFSIDNSQSGKNVPPFTSNIKYFWLRIKTPLSTSTTNQQSITITISAEPGSP